MTRRAAHLVLACLLALPPRAHAAPSTNDADTRAARLAALTPDKPLDYFLLAEEVLDDAKPDVDLARQLLVRALLLDQNNTLTPSALRLLARIADDAAHARAMEALAEAAAPSSSPYGPIDPRPDPLAASSLTNAETALTAATALGRYRSGDYARSASLFDRPEVRNILNDYSALLPGLSAIVREVHERPNCRECHNARIVRADASSSEAINNARLCYTCRGNPGPRLSDRDFLNQLRVEAALLNAQHASWSTQFLMDGAAPLHDLDPSSLADLYHVDAAATRWHDGAWFDPSPPPQPAEPEPAQTSTNP